MSTALSVYTELSRNSVDQEIALNNCSLSINYDVLHGLFINVVSSFNYKRITHIQTTKENVERQIRQTLK